MKAIKQGGLAVAVALVLAIQSAHGFGQQVSAKAMEEVAGSSLSGETKRTIVVSLQDRKLALLEDGQVKKIYPVAVGKASTPSPVGTFTIERRVMNPTYSHNGRVVPPGPGNPVGTRWMGLSIKGYGIHGTNEPKSIGKAASHGCIRMAKADIQELYSLVAVGDTVELVGERNEETAQLFGDGQNPVRHEATSPGTASPVQSAKLAPVPAKDASGVESAKSAGSDSTAVAAIAGAF